MSGRLIYLAGALDSLEYDGTAWYDVFNEHRPDDVLGFMPGRAYLGASWMTREAVHTANRAMLAASLGLVVNLSQPGRALGTIREIEFARSLGKPVIAVGEITSSLASWDLRHADSLEHAAKILVEGRK